MLAAGRFFQPADQTHAQRAMGTDGFEARQCGGVAVDVVLQLGTRIAQRRSVEKNSGNARIDEGRLESAHPRHVKFVDQRSEEHTSELQSLMRISYAVFCLKKKKQHKQTSIK